MGLWCYSVVVVDEEYQVIVFLGVSDESGDGKDGPDEEHIYISHIGSSLITAATCHHRGYVLSSLPFYQPAGGQRVDVITRIVRLWR